MYIRKTLLLKHIDKKSMEEFEQTAVKRNLAIHNSHSFIKSEDKTQIVRPKKIEKDVYKTRQTHSEEVSIIGEMVCHKIGFKYVNQVRNVCLLHDIGHPPFGHSGQTILNKKLIKLGLKEGFNDNNANFDVIVNNDIEVSSYEIVSLIKRPEKLYNYQKKIFKNIIKETLDFEKKEWGKKTKSMGSLIMDISDEIAYSFSDFIDGYVLGYNKHYIINFINKMIKFTKNQKIKKSLKSIDKSLNLSGSKRELRSLVTDLKNLVIESIYYDYSQCKLKMKNNNYELVELFSQFNQNYFIFDSELVYKRKKDIKIFSEFCDYILENKNFTSDLYRRKHFFVKSKRKNELRNIRNMIGDSTDNFVLSFMKKLKKYN